MNKKNEHLIQLLINDDWEDDLLYWSKTSEAAPFDMVEGKKVSNHSFIQMTGLNFVSMSKSLNKIFSSKNPTLNPYDKTARGQKFIKKNEDGDLINSWRLRIFLRSEYKEFKRDYDNGILRVNYFTNDIDSGGIDDQHLQLFYQSGSNFEIEVFANDKDFTYLKNYVLDGRKELKKEEIYFSTSGDDLKYKVIINLDSSPTRYITPVYSDKDKQKIEDGINRISENVDKDYVGKVYGIKECNFVKIKEQSIEINEKTYLGEWKNDEYHGQGTLKINRWKIIKGIWKNGELIKK